MLINTYNVYDTIRGMENIMRYECNERKETQIRREIERYRETETETKRDRERRNRLIVPIP